MRMMSKINIESIRPGDRVKVSLHGLPESDWLPVVESGDGFVYVGVPDGDHIQQDAEDHDITAHEPATPALPDWWGSKVIKATFYDDGQAYYPYDEAEDDYVGVTGISRKPEFFEGLDVTVVVDRDGNQPAAQCPDGGLGKMAAEPAAPALPEWWGSLVIRENNMNLAGDVRFYLYFPPVTPEDGHGAYAADMGSVGLTWFHADESWGDVTVVVDRDGNQPAVDGVWSASAAEALKAELYEAERMRDEWEGMYKITLATHLDLRRVAAERDEARADLAALRAGVAEVRDDLGGRSIKWVHTRLSAILDGADQ